MKANQHGMSLRHACMPLRCLLYGMMLLLLLPQPASAMCLVCQALDLGAHGEERPDEGRGSQYEEEGTPRCDRARWQPRSLVSRLFLSDRQPRGVLALTGWPHIHERRGAGVHFLC